MLVLTSSDRATQSHKLDMAILQATLRGSIALVQQVGLDQSADCLPFLVQRWLFRDRGHSVYSRHIVERDHAEIVFESPGNSRNLSILNIREGERARYSQNLLATMRQKNVGFLPPPLTARKGNEGRSVISDPMVGQATLSRWSGVETRGCSGVKIGFAGSGLRSESKRCQGRSDWCRSG